MTRGPYKKKSAEAPLEKVREINYLEEKIDKLLAKPSEEFTSRDAKKLETIKDIIEGIKNTPHKERNK